MSGAVARWLAQESAHYSNQDKASVDFLHALDRFPTVKPKTDVYSTRVPPLTTHTRTLTRSRDLSLSNPALMVDF
jgi:hypothetical protein